MDTTENNLPVGQETLREFMRILQRYKAGKTATEQRIVASENWWKLRNAAPTDTGDFVSRSGWLHNVIVSKHADALEAYPEPNILPREQEDVAQAKLLSAVIPCVLELNRFEQTYSDVMWQKLKTGTGVYKVVWDKSKLGGLGDISIRRVNLLNLYWEPGITDIQKSRYLFHTELHSKDVLQQQYPQLKGKLKGNGFVSTRFLYDDAVNDTDKATVIDVYYRCRQKGKTVLHYCKFVDDTLLYATENDFRPVESPTGELFPPPAEAGLYDHGQYPYVFDTLYPVEGSPCGYGYVDICRNPQTEIDLLKTAFIRNARVGAVPRYFSRIDGNVNEEQFLDLEQALVQVSGNVDEATLRRIEHTGLDSNYIALLDRTVDELRQTSGNTEVSTGAAASGVTAASAIAALQEAAGKGSRDATRNAYRAFGQLVELCIELIRQFYRLPRQFRIAGESGSPEFLTYSNSGILPQPQPLGAEMGLRLPVFDIKVSAQKKTVYTKVSQNELALQFFKMGFFDPRMADQALTCLEMMDFDDKDRIVNIITKNAGLEKRLLQYMGMTMDIAPQLRPKVEKELSQLTGKLPVGDALQGLKNPEHARVQKARQQAAQAPIVP